MSITSSMSTDSSAQTASMNIYFNGSTIIDSFSYSSKSNQFSFSARPSVTLGISDFVTHIGFIINFNLTLLSMPFYNGSQIISPISSCNTLINDDGVSQFNWVFTPGGHDLMNFVCAYPYGGVSIVKRGQDLTLSFPQWAYFLQEIAQYKQIIRCIYKI